MIRRSISFPRELWQAARRKAGLTPLSAIIRRLLRMWLAGKIELDEGE